MSHSNPAQQPLRENQSAQILSYLPSSFFWRRRLMIETAASRLHGVVQSIRLELDHLRLWAAGQGVNVLTQKTPAMPGASAAEARKLGLALVMELEGVKECVRDAGLIPLRTRMDPCEACMRGIRPGCDQPVCDLRERLGLGSDGETGTSS